MSYKIKIGCYRILSRMYFYLPVLVIYLHLQNLTFFKITVIMALYSIGSLLGTYTRRYLNASRKLTLMISGGMKIGGLLFFVSSMNLVSLCIGQLLLGLSFGMGAGVDSELIYQFIPEPEPFQRKSNSWMFLAVLVSGFMGYLFFDLDYRFPFGASLITETAAVMICMSLPKDCVKKDKKKLPDFKLPKNSRKTVFRYASMKGVILTIFTALVPYYLFVDYQVHGMQFIFIILGYTVAGNITSRIADKVNEKWLNLLLPLSLLIYLGKSIAFLVIATIFIGGISGILRPLTFQRLRNEGTDITVGSAHMEMLYGMINIVLLITGGAFYSALSFNAVMLFYFLFLVFSILFAVSLKEK